MSLDKLKNLVKTRDCTSENLEDISEALRFEVKRYGLYVYFRNRGDASDALDLADDAGLTAEFDPSEGSLFFPEDQDTYDELEKELDKIFRKIKGYSIEGVF